MSSTVRCYGFIAALNNPITDEDEREEFTEKLYDQKSMLHLNYDGTLAYIDYNSTKPYSVREDIYGLWIGEDGGKPDDLLSEAQKHGLSIDPLTRKPFNCIYYNGGDNPVNMLTLDEFKAKI